MWTWTWRQSLNKPENTFWRVQLRLESVPGCPLKAWQKENVHCEWTAQAELPQMQNTHILWRVSSQSRRRCVPALGFTSKNKGVVKCMRVWAVASKTLGFKCWFCTTRASWLGEYFLMFLELCLLNWKIRITTPTCLQDCYKDRWNEHKIPNAVPGTYCAIYGTITFLMYFALNCRVLKLVMGWWVLIKRQSPRWQLQKLRQSCLIVGPLFLVLNCTPGWADIEILHGQCLVSWVPGKENLPGKITWDLDAAQQSDLGGL